MEMRILHQFFHWRCYC